MTASPILWELPHPLSCHELLCTTQNCCLYICVIPFSRAAGERGRTYKRRNVPNRKCQHFPTCNWLIRTVLTGGALLGLRTKLRSSKCENGAIQSVTGRKMLTLPVWWAKQEVTIFTSSPKCPTSREAPFLWKRGKSINCRRETAGTSCLARKTGFTIVFPIPRHPIHEKTVEINQLLAGKFWHFLFDKQNRKWSHFELHHCVQHP